MIPETIWVQVWRMVQEVRRQAWLCQTSLDARDWPELQRSVAGLMRATVGLSLYLKQRSNVRSIRPGPGGE